MAPVGGTYYTKEGQDNRQKVAIVGSGLAGLTTAYLLNRDNYDVEIFEMVSWMSSLAFQPLWESGSNTHLSFFRALLRH